MFAPDPRLSFIPATREQVVSVFVSLNKPHIAVPGKVPQEVMGFVVGANNNAGTYTLFVSLFLTETLEAVVYLDHQRLQVDAASYRDAEAEALGFLESMGFMCEPLNFRGLDAEQQIELMKTLPCFARDLKALAPGAAAEARAERVESPQIKLARLLAAF